MNRADFSQFFIALWNELQARARHTEVNDSVAGPMTLGDVKDVISSSLGSDEDGGGMFDESVSTFKALRSKAEQLIIQAIKYAYPTSLRPYFHKPQWTTITNEPVSMEALNITAELDQTLQVRRSTMPFCLLNKQELFGILIGCTRPKKKILSFLNKPWANQYSDASGVSA